MDRNLNGAAAVIAIAIIMVGCCVVTKLWSDSQDDRAEIRRLQLQVKQRERAIDSLVNDAAMVDRVINRLQTDNLHTATEVDSLKGVHTALLNRYNTLRNESRKRINNMPDSLQMELWGRNMQRFR